MNCRICLRFEMELTGFDAVEIDMALAVEESGTDTIAHDAAEDIGVLPARLSDAATSTASVDT